jgi:hypothetical protein
MQGCATALGFRRCTLRAGAISRSGASAEPARPSSSWRWPRASASAPWPPAPSPATTGPRVRPQPSRGRWRRPSGPATTAATRGHGLRQWPRGPATATTITGRRGRRPLRRRQPFRSRRRHRLRP